MRSHGRRRPSEAPSSGAGEVSRACSNSTAHRCSGRFGSARCQPQTASPLRTRCLQAQATAKACLHRPCAAAPAPEVLSSVSSVQPAPPPPRARALDPRARVLVGNYCGNLRHVSPIGSARLRSPMAEQASSRTAATIAAFSPPLARARWNRSPAAGAAPPRAQRPTLERAHPLADAPTRRGAHCGRSARRSTSWSSTSPLLGSRRVPRRVSALRVRDRGRAARVRSRLSAAVGSRRPRRCPGSLRRASGAPRSGRCGNVLPDASVVVGLES